MIDVVNGPESRLNEPQSALAVQAPQETGHDWRPERNAVIVIVLLWALQFAYFSVDRLIREPQAEGLSTIAARLAVSAFGILLSLIVLRLLRKSVGLSFVKRAVLAIALAAAAAVVHSVANLLVFRIVVGPGPDSSLTPDMLALSMRQLTYFFLQIHLVVAVILLSLTYGEEIVRRERKIADLAGQLGSLKELGTGADSPHLWIRRGKERVRLDVAAISWIAAEGECVRLHCGDQSYLERMAVAALADRLEPLGFVRVHRSAVVNLAQVESLARTDSGTLQLRLRDGSEIRVSKSFQPLVRRLFQGRAGLA